MPLRYSAASMRRLQRDFVELAQGAVLLEGAKTEINALIEEQFSKGIAPDGTPLKQTVRHRDALVSRKLATLFQSRVDRGILRYVGKSKRDMLEAHQHGHEFPARSVAANQQHMNFNSKGKLVAERRIWRKDGRVRRGAYQRFAAAHSIRARVLPERQLVPETTLPARYEEAIDRGATKAMMRWHEKAAR